MARPTIILDLCGGSGAWSWPYKQAGYDVRIVDVFKGSDVRLLEFPGSVHGILAAPPCTHLAGSGARHWERKGDGPLFRALSIADACLRLVALCQPTWWALENPVGRLSRFYGPPALRFDPCDYGDPWTKRTCLWGRFHEPKPDPVEPVLGSKIHKMSGSDKRGRSETPPGFAKAFFEANP